MSCNHISITKVAGSYSLRQSHRRWLRESIRSLWIASIIGSSCSLAQADRQLVLNPYKNIDWEGSSQYKANFHTHTTVSDGHYPPHEVVDMYRNAGYKILAITDHNESTYPWEAFDKFLEQTTSGNRTKLENRSPGELGMIAVAGNELSDHHHLLSLFSDFTTENKNLTSSLEGIASEFPEGIAFLAHPFHSWSLKAGSISIPLTDAFRNLTMDDFTIEAWFCTTDTRRNILLGNHTAGEVATGSINLELHTQNRVRVLIQAPEENGGGVLDLLARADTIGIDTRDGKWHHLAAVRSDGEFTLYLDGVKLMRRADNLGPFMLEGDYLYIGRDARVNNRFHDAISVMTHPTTFSGYLDHIRFWSGGLSNEEVVHSTRGNDGSLKNSGNAILAEYTMEKVTHVQSLQNGIINNATIIDTGNHTEGPFHAKASLLKYASEVPEHLYKSGRSSRSAGFGLSHPLGWKHIPDILYNHYQQTISDHTHLIGLEVHGSTGRRSPLDIQLWERLLHQFMPERPIWGIANDDMHSIEQFGRNWSVFTLKHLDRAVIRQSMLDGAYYFVSTDTHSAEEGDPSHAPQIKKIFHNPKKGTIEVSAKSNGQSIPSGNFRWIFNGKTIQTGPVFHYRNVEIKLNYIRLEIRGNGGTTFTNPFGFN